MPKGPNFIRYFQPILDALRELGESGRPREVYPIIARKCEISEAELEETNKNGASKFENQVAWARFYLSKAGYVESPRRGVWALSELGRHQNLSAEDGFHLFKKIHDQIQSERELNLSDEEILAQSDEDEASSEFEAPDERQYFNEDDVRQKLNQHFGAMSPDGFERFCAYLLRAFGLQNVKVTGKSGDQGIDGEGDLFINRFVRTKVMFQSKRYTGSVGPKEIRDFRGAILGRAERGVFLTTGVFTTSAKAEASRENTIPIELIDLDELVELAISERVGVAEVQALQVNDGFFDKYKQA